MRTIEELMGLLNKWDRKNEYGIHYSIRFYSDGSGRFMKGTEASKKFNSIGEAFKILENEINPTKTIKLCGGVQAEINDNRVKLSSSKELRELTFHEIEDIYNAMKQ